MLLTAFIKKLIKKLNKYYCNKWILIQMVFYLNLIRIIGLNGKIGGDIINPDNDIPNIIIDIESGQTVKIIEEDVNINCTKKCCKYTFNSLYFAMIILFLLWPCIYSIVRAIMENEVKYFITAQKK